MSERKKLVARLDRIFSKYIRLRDADHAGYVNCWTCGKTKHYTKLDAGHFQTRAKYSTRWDKMNVKPQCKGCNMVNGGQQYMFGLNLDRAYGEGTAEEIVRRSNQTRKFSDEELKDMIRHYSQLVNKLL